MLDGGNNDLELAATGVESTGSTPEPEPDKDLPAENSHTNRQLVKSQSDPSGLKIIPIAPLIVPEIPVFFGEVLYNRSVSGSPLPLDEPDPRPEARTVLAPDELLYTKGTPYPSPGRKLFEYEMNPHPPKSLGTSPRASDASPPQESRTISTFTWNLSYPENDKPHVYSLQQLSISHYLPADSIGSNQRASENPDRDSISYVPPDSARPSNQSPSTVTLTIQTRQQQVLAEAGDDTALVLASASGNNSPVLQQAALKSSTAIATPVRGPEIATFTLPTKTTQSKSIFCCCWR